MCPHSFYRTKNVFVEFFAENSVLKSKRNQYSNVPTVN